jgi:hypothetical protein
MNQNKLLQRAQRALNDGETEEAIESLLSYAEGRATATILGDNDSEAVFESLFADVMGAAAMPRQRGGAR